ncbi:exodeoxyribonuclease V subunit alpha [Marinobacter sp. SS21]|uniref:exodeoxyribonuclease V subunit alpha n=1 Tax=Marinobacter sp. SS21 TaxID=2979460 RepID=UPI0023301A47|nr:exodeoxyribonuclease V subunit alpha [Marinobacter sp. SS21]MDC0663375.1 exodeoxyribonuclease V subunit alpha [Marinobacter sp. SS21]
MARTDAPVDKLTDAVEALSPSSVLASPDNLARLLAQWLALGWLRALDVALVTFLRQQADLANQPADTLLLLAAALTSHQLGRGHVCLDLKAMAEDGYNNALSLPPEDVAAPERHLLPSELMARVSDEDWLASLQNPLLVDQEGDPQGNTPLVRQGMRLYLRRYWQYEQQIHQRLATRLAPLQAMEDAKGAGAQALARALAALFPSALAEDVDWQKVACGNAARQAFSIVTGGPGTGKTTTVVKLLAALQHIALTSPDTGRALRIRLAAPTGKAAARLNESIAGAVNGLELGDLPDSETLRAAIPTSVTTLHRLLGSKPGSRNFRHHRDNPLVVDVLVIDEASMVDLEMMAKVLDALPDQARLILLGDKDQLASVDAGAVLGDMCQRADRGGYRAASASWLETVTRYRLPEHLISEAGAGLDQAVAMLRRSYRFGVHSGIGQLASAVNGGGCEERSVAEVAREVLAADYRDLALVRLRGSDIEQTIGRHCIEGGAGCFPERGVGRIQGDRVLEPPMGYQHYLRLMKSTRPSHDAPAETWDAWASEVLTAYGQFQLLCALRRGPYGVEALNELITAGLRRAGLIGGTEGWYAGRPVLVTRNDYSLGLMNGDIGIALDVPARQWRAGEQALEPGHCVMRVAFPAGDGSGRIRWVLPSRLQQVETVYAMTVHKSQGSEFVHTCLILPDRISPVLTRELVYTGITRARHWFSLLLPDERVFEQALARQVRRSSGLGELLLGSLA